LKDSFKYKGALLFTINVDSVFLTSFSKPSRMAASSSLTPSSPTVAEFIGEVVPPALPAVPHVPGFVHVVDESKAGANVVIQQVAADMAVDDDDESDAVSEAPEITDDVTLKDVMRKLNTIEKQHKHDSKRSREKTRVLIAEAVDPLWGEMRSVQSDVVDLGKASIAHDDRIGRLESQFANLNTGKSNKFNPNDVAHLRMSFSGFKGDSLDDRVETLKAFMDKHFKQETFACVDTRATGAWNDQKPTGESFVQFHCRAARDRALKAVRDGKLAENLKSKKGDKLTVNRYRTDWQRGRDWAMRKSEELIRDKIEAVKLTSTTKVEYVQAKDERKIIVNGQIAFIQKRADAHGAFVNEFAELKLP